MFFEFDSRNGGGGVNGRTETESLFPNAGGWDGNPVDDFARESAAAMDAPAVERALTSAARGLLGSRSARFVPLQRRGLDPGFEAAVVASRPGARIWGWLVADEPVEGLGDRAGMIRRRLQTLGMTAAGALDRLAKAPRVDPPTSVRGGKWRVDSPAVAAGADSPVPGVHDETFLHAVLPLIFNQAERYSEPLSVLCVAVDRIEGIRSLLGPDQADRTIRGVAREIVARIRSSDLAARLDDGRLVLVLPRVEIDGALMLAAQLRRAVAEKAKLISDAPGLTVSIGAAAYPSLASDLVGLRVAALSALSSARALGGDRAEPAPALAPRLLLRRASCEV